MSDTETQRLPLNEIEDKPYSLMWASEPHQGFLLDTPWWPITNKNLDGKAIYYGAVKAKSLMGAKWKIAQAYLKHPVGLIWIDAIEQPSNWQPFNNKYPFSDWMVW